MTDLADLARRANEVVTFLAAGKAPTPAQIIALRRCAEELARLDRLVNTPQTAVFLDSVKLEMAHQAERWPPDHDGSKSAADWLWLIAHLATKAHEAQRMGMTQQTLHHTISTAAVCGHWHRQISGEGP